MYKKILIITLSLTLSIFSADKIESVIYRNKPFKIIHPNEIKEIGKPIVYENGILFTYSGHSGEDVRLSGSFVSWQKKFKLKTNDFGLFFIFLPLELQKGNYIYRYCVDDVWINDPSQKLYTNDGYGTRITLFHLKNNLINRLQSPKKIGSGKYKFFLKDNEYKQVSWIGSKNNWDPYVDKMRLKEGYWTITMTIDKKQNFYKYSVDGVMTLDPNNPHITMLKFEEAVNYVAVK